MFKAERRISPFTLNCWYSNTEIAQLRATRVQHHLPAYGLQDVFHRKLRARVEIANISEAHCPVAFCVNLSEDLSRCVWRCDEPGGPGNGILMQVEQFGYLFGAQVVDPVKHFLASLIRAVNL